MAQSFHHIPIMVNEVLEHLAPKPGGLYLDGTLGGGGHAQAVLSRIRPGGRLIGIDRDEEALEAAQLRLQGDKDTSPSFMGTTKRPRSC